MTTKLVVILVLFPIYLLLHRSVKKKCRKTGIESTLEYGVIPKIVTLIALSLALTLLLFTAFQPNSDDKFTVLSMSLVFVVMTLYLVCKTFFYKIKYDNKGLHYRSPLGRSTQALWSELESVGHSRRLDMKYFILRGKRKIWYTDWMNGFDEFDTFLWRMRHTPVGERR